MTTTLMTQWLEPADRSERARIRLFCFSHAGGSAAAFREWRHGLPADIDVCAVQLPGRGQRIFDPPFSDASPLVDAAATALYAYIDRPFAFYGHSMGALIAFELARLMARCGKRVERLFVAASPAPHLNAKCRGSSHLTDPQFIEHLRRLKGTPPELLENEEAMQLLMPVLRADFHLVETYRYVPAPPLECPITAIGGTADEVPQTDLEGWREHTPSCSVTMVPGDHFLRGEADVAVRKVILRDLQPVLERLEEPATVRGHSR